MTMFYAKTECKLFKLILGPNFFVTLDLDFVYNMISIWYSCIPCYLHESLFYKSLSDEDQEGEIEIPEHCFAENDNVINEQEFARLLQVIAFWGMPKIPLSMIMFCNNDVKGWATHINEEHATLQFAQDLVYIFTTQLDPAVSSKEIFYTNKRKLDSPLVRSIRRERTEIVEFLALTPSNEIESAAASAEMGRLDYLQLLHKSGHAWSEKACTLATKGGHLECLRYLHGNGCSWCVRLLYAATVEYDQFACLKYLVEQGVPWAHLAEYIASHGNLRLLKYAAEKGCPFTSTATYNAAWGGHAECLRYLLNTVACELDIGAVAAACRGNHLECVQILHEHGAEWRTEACAAAAENGHFACLIFLYENGCPWNDQTSFGAAKRGDIEMLHYVLSRGCPYSPLILEITASCVTESGFQCFKYLVEDVKVPTTNFSAMLNHSFTQGNHFIFQYVFELEPTCQSQKITWPFELRWILHSMRQTTQFASWMQTLCNAFSTHYSITGTLTSTDTIWYSLWLRNK